MTCHRTQIPSLQDTVDMLILPRKIQRTAVHQDQTKRFTRLFQFFQQGLLSARQLQVRTASRLATPVEILAHSRQYDIGTASRSDRLSEFRLIIRQEVTSLGINELHVRTSIFLGQALEQGDTLLTLTPAGPFAILVDLILYHRSDQSYRNILILRDREEVIIILQKDDRASGSLTSLLQELRLHDRILLTLIIQITIRIIEQAQEELHLQDARHGTVDILFRDLTLFHGLYKMLTINTPCHIHIDASVRGQFSRLFIIPYDAMGHHLIDTGIIGNHETIEAPVLT